MTIFRPRGLQRMDETEPKATEPKAESNALRLCQRGLVDLLMALLELFSRNVALRADMKLDSMQLG
jgi:hypothetical protein